MSRRRVVVTGLGAVSPAGLSVAELWAALLDGRHAFRPISSFDASSFRSQVGAEVRGAERGCAAFAEEAARQALDGNAVDPARTGVALGTTLGDWLSIEQALADGGDAAAFLPGSVPARVARRFGLRGPNLASLSACAAGNYALIWAFERIASGRADAMVAGGAELFNRLYFAGFSSVRALAPDVCAPFSLGRRGVIPGEGAAVLLLEEAETARRRGARVYAEVRGYGVSSDARHLTQPDPDGVRASIEDCLRDAALAPSDVGYIVAHGTGTPANDRVESGAVAAVFGESPPPLSSIKSQLGHAMGASAALSGVVGALALDTGWLPPTANFTPGDPACRLDYVTDGKRRAEPRVVLSNSFGFGGTNAVLALARPGGDAPPRPEARVVVTGAALFDDADPVAAAERLFPGRDLGVLDAAIASAICGAALAHRDAGLPPDAQAGVIVDVDGDLRSQRPVYDALLRLGPAGVTPHQFANVSNCGASRSAMALGLRRLNATLGGAFPGGESAVACGWDFVRSHPEAAVVCGGVDEAAGFLVLESLDAARARGARILAELTDVQEGWDGQPGKAACGCLIEAVRKGGPVELRARNRWGSWVRISMKPPEP